MPSSPFNIHQHQSSESKIVVALERISEAFRVLLWDAGKAYGLSPIQTQILIFLLFHSPEKCKVGYLAAEFNMTKATISDSVKSLLQKGLVEKLDDEKDSRSFGLALTKEGKKVARETSLFAGAIQTPLSTLTPAQKEIMLNGLLRLIQDLNKAGVITPQRMCFNCRFYEDKNGTHFCNLLNSPLANPDLRVDCPEHVLLQ